ncbi:MAG: glycosyltransferase [Psychroflexus sp.]|nr:glycosyltransferase [Psychroflexus sp.]
MIPHYNNLGGLKDSIKSIDESINADIVIVDDGSKIKPQKKDIEYSHGNIFIIKLPQNAGIEHALNTGLSFIKKQGYEFTGRLDCGDLCKKNRFKKQINYLRKHKKIVLVGGWVNVIDSKGHKKYITKHPSKHKEISKKMYLNSMFVHPSVLFKTSILDKIGVYPTHYKAAEDYAFFFNVVKKFKTANLEEVLIDYIIDDNSISSQKRKIQVKSRIRVILNHFYLGYYPIYGLIRNIILLSMSRNMSTALKKLFYSKK